MSQINEILFNCSISQNVQRNLRQLLKNNPNGIWSTNLEREYKKAFKDELTLKEYGCASVLHMCNSLPYICKQVQHLKDFKIFSTDAIIPVDILTNDDQKYISTVIPFGTVIPREQLPATNEFITIKITQVHDLSKFWFYTTHNENKLNQVMKKMEIFYNSEPAAYYKIPPYQLNEGLYCAAIYCGQFHRALIVDNLPELSISIKVYFIDFGTLDLVDISQIYYLHKSFETMNALAMRGRIAGIKPIGLNMPWQSSVVYKFELMIQQKSLQAEIESTTREDDVYIYTLKLLHKSPGSMIWIHEDLAELDAVAKQCNQQDASKSIPEFINNKCMMHLLPSFNELENGRAPNRDVLYSMEEMGLSLPAIYENYIRS